MNGVTRKHIALYILDKFSKYNLQHIFFGIISSKSIIGYVYDIIENVFSEYEEVYDERYKANMFTLFFDKHYDLHTDEYKRKHCEGVI